MLAFNVIYKLYPLIVIGIASAFRAQTFTSIFNTSRQRDAIHPAPVGY